ncbi:MAG TPA: glycosyltransferase family 87 protein [Solirubrobacteraceae bacterium]|nr:glycosyltransferase family 87 protein [Solirubrobacteraceae bacterium]
MRASSVKHARARLATATARVDPVVLVALLAAAVALWLAVKGRPLADWNLEARPSVDALLAGHLDAFFRLAPAYGGSLLLRAPWMALGRLAGGGRASDYVAGVLPCVLAAVVLALWLSVQLRRRGQRIGFRAAAVAVCVSGPIGIIAIQQGHPEELLGAVLCAAAVLCAERERAVWSGVLVGLAIANKEWGLLAAGPVLVALPRERGRAFAAMIATAGAVLAPFLLVRAGGFVGQTEAVALHSASIFGPLQLWWFLGAPAHGGARIAPAWLGGLGHTLPIALMVPLTLLYGRRTRRNPARRGRDATLLLALLLLLRCALDPWDVVYYPAPFLMALLAWETTTQEHPPLLSIAAPLVTWYVFQGLTYPFTVGQDATGGIFAVVTIGAIGAIGRRLFGRPRARPARGVPQSRRTAVPEAAAR